MEEENWTLAAQESELKDDRKAISLNGQNILLIRKDDEIFAVENRCIHMNCKFTRGELNGYNLKCPCHDWEFDIRSGEMTVASELKLAVYPAKIDSGTIYIEMGD
ncbi:3-phenylpropionate/trans-cinnamate dioxygenase ferredoxin subunit [Methanohalophilus levihalophilus]|uniref:Rieske (2Fe-2S) protein n=1 Tax=Methanohalophilus levihalophilus TaxID=1431282 RepID=UPI001AEB9D8C|nr:Rieske (2Fe-2S) protein [Methanohalophilus levihalophilus]MBP2029837.1 3-phenylpropionate/trans-cinnamate dioxygenase ferredoxin subunit [Methanohalophilus levihalophilus]